MVGIMRRSLASGERVSVNAGVYKLGTNESRRFDNLSDCSPYILRFTTVYSTTVQPFALLPLISAATYFPSPDKSIWVEELDWGMVIIN